MHSEQRCMFTFTYSHHGNQTALRLLLSPPVDDKQVLNFTSSLSMSSSLSSSFLFFFFPLFTASQSHSFYKYQLCSVKRGTDEGLRSALDTISAEKKTLVDQTAKLCEMERASCNHHGSLWLGQVREVRPREGAAVFYDLPSLNRRIKYDTPNWTRRI